MVGRKTKNVLQSKRTPAKKRPGGPAAAALSPLDYLLQVMRNPIAPAEMRFEAAKTAAPLVHPLLAVIVHKGDS